MKIENIKLINFRNYQNQTIAFKEGINILLGKNAQGKTNLLEAIYFSCIGKSPRTKREQDLILWEKENSKIEISLQKIEGTKNIELYLYKKGKKNIRINGINILKIADLIGVLNCVFFSPDELKLIKEAPQDRRRFLDIDLSQLSRHYFYLINTYNKILLQRNKLLKDTTSLKTLMQTINIWDTQLAKVGSKIIKRRLDFLNLLKVQAKIEHFYLTDNKEDLEIIYEGIVAQQEQEIEDELLKSYAKNLEKDFKLGFTTTGPHRDDVDFLINGVSAKSFASQGQQRTIALSLKLAELEIFAKELGEYPILLLDDVLSELDEGRKQKLLQKTRHVQTIITTTNFNYDIEANIINIKNGSVF